ncbi:MAG TPA: Zn-binding domain-containing protein, partial [Solirubrobacterales bacterium]|nr:Zn-binding domain-containing protein [Solirubrobacterales bacterium]
EVRTICFLKSRRGIELIQRFARDHLKERGKVALADRIAPYRGGYTAAQRRDIEARLSAGELLAVVATDALELGIDVGDLDAAICVTFPGTVASLRQMWGRAGRGRKGLAIYVAGSDALDQFFCRHPEEFLERPVEAAILDHANEQIAMRHLLAAAYELPLDDEDEEIFGAGWRERAQRLLAAGELRQSGERLLPRESGFIASKISLRSASNDSVTVFDSSSGEMLGLVEMERAFTTVHPGAIYLHMGNSYEVRELDIDGRRAVVSPFEGDWYTRPKKETDIYIERIREQREVAGVDLFFGDVSVTEQVIAFQRVSISDQQPVDIVGLDLPEQSFVTQALWYVLPKGLSGELPRNVLLGALHATEHGQIAVLPLIAMCDRWDIGGLSTNVHFQTGLSTIFIYDGYPGGVGISLRGYEAFEQLLDDAERLIGECPCESGCPSCVQSPKCGNLNEPLSKGGALELMGLMKKAGGQR